MMEWYEYKALYDDHARKVLKEMDQLHLTREEACEVEDIVEPFIEIISEGPEHRYFDITPKLIALFFQGVKYGIKKAAKGDFEVKRTRITRPPSNLL